MIQLIRALQMVVHLPMLRIIMPANAILFISVIIEIAMFDVLPAESSTDLMFEYSESESDEKIFGQMQDIGYESSQSLKNLGSLSIFTFLYFVKLVVLFFMRAMIQLTPVGQSKNFKKLYDSMVKTAFFSDILAILIDAYFEFLISGYQQHSEISKFSEIETGRLLQEASQSSGDVASLWVANFGLVLILVMVPIAFGWMLIQDIETIRSNEFEHQYGPLYEGLKLENKWYLSYYVIFVLRRLLFFGVAIMRTETDSAYM